MGPPTDRLRPQEVFPLVGRLVLLLLLLSLPVGRVAYPLTEAVRYPLLPVTVRPPGARDRCPGLLPRL